MSIDFNELALENERLSREPGTGSSGSNTNVYVKLPDGNCACTVRILPYIKLPNGKPKIYQSTRTHRINDYTIHCRKELSNGKWVGDCAICDYVASRYKKRDNALKQNDTELAERLDAEINEIRPVERYYYPVVVRGEQNAVPKIYSCGKQVHARIIRAMCGDPSTNELPLGDVTDRVNGRDFKIVKRHKGGPKNYPEYTDSKFLDPSPLGTPDQSQYWENNRPDIESLRKVLSKEEVEREVDIYLGKIPNPRKSNRYDEVDGHAGGGAASALSASRYDDDDVPSPPAYQAPTPTMAAPQPQPQARYETPVTQAAPVTSAPVSAPVQQESAPLDHDDFLKRLREI